MRDLISFLINRHALLLFLFLELIAFFLINQNNTYHRSSLFNSSNVVSGSILNVFSNSSSYLSLGEVNENLLNENARLKEYIANLSANQYTEIDTLSMNDSIRYVIKTARVINNSTNKMHNHISLNLGSNDGISPEMGVLGDSGIVGVVKNVSGKFSTVMSLLHNDLRISGKIRKNDYAGNLKWDGKNPEIISLIDIPKHINLVKGDTIITSGYGSFFPEGHLVGTVDDFRIMEGTNFYEIDVKLATDYRNLSSVYVIKDKYKEERLELESENE